MENELEFECAGCGKTVDYEKIQTTPDGGRHLCPDCFDNEFRACDECGEYFSEDSLTQVHRQVEIVRTPLTGRTTSSGIPIFGREVRTVMDDEYLCEHCYDALHFRQCIDCDGHFEQSRMIRYGGPNEWLCRSCYCEDYFTCDDCGSVFHNDDYGGDGYCCDCTRVHEEQENNESYNVEDATRRVLATSRNISSVSFKRDVNLDKIIDDPSSEI